LQLAIIVVLCCRYVNKRVPEPSFPFYSPRTPVHGFISYEMF